MLYRVYFSAHGAVLCEADSPDEVRELFAKGALDEDISTNLAGAEIELTCIEEDNG